MNKKALQFFQTLTPEILSPSDYVNWEVINRKVKVLRREIALLQSLDKSNPVEDLTDLLHKNPKLLKVLQILIAHTPQKIFFDDKDKYIDFKEDEKVVAGDIKRAKAIAEIFVAMGLVEFLKEVRSVEDIVKGVLIGLEPNARKNRRGSKLESVLDSLIASTIEKINKKYKTGLAFEPQMYVDLANERKKIDYVILQNGKPKIAIEINFYSTSGSKPSEVLGRAYPEVQTNLKKKGLGFIVITDGIGWESMRPVIYTAYEKLDYLMNIKQARDNMLELAIIELLEL